jgi:formylglycine-generating enzyme required for sulfatase activity
VFMDVDTIPLGLNFIKVLREEVEKCDALLAVIGPSWATITDKQGNPRINDSNDFVRIEIATALTRDIPVIPVLLDGAEIPRPEQLPEDLKELAVRNGLQIHHASFHADMDRLVAGLKSTIGRGDTAPVPLSTQERAIFQPADPRVAEPLAAAKKSGSRTAAILGGVAIVAAAAIAGFLVEERQAPQTTIAAIPPPPAVEAPAPKVEQKADAAKQAPQAAPTAAVPVQSPPAIAPPAALVQAPPAPPPSASEAQPIQQSSPTPTAAPTKTAQAPVTPLTSERERALKAGDSFKECENCPEMVTVPAGEFVMGSPEAEQGRSTDEGPQHAVTLAKPFAAGKFEVTVDQFSAFVKDTGYDAGSKCLTLEDGKSAIREGRAWRNPGYSQTGSHPVACVSWNDAKAYLDWLAKKTGKGYRLLTEAEWEYAARGVSTRGAGSRYVFGDDDGAMCRYGNVADKTARQIITGASGWSAFPCADGYAYAAPVGVFSANAFGLYDVHGNVWEWTEDCYSGNYSGAPADAAPWTAGDCDHRVVRGGMWGSSPANVRLARRYKEQIATRSQDIGFRVARAMEQ